MFLSEICRGITECLNITEEKNVTCYLNSRYLDIWIWYVTYSWLIYLCTEWWGCPYNDMRAVFCWNKTQFETLGQTVLNTDNPCKLLGFNWHCKLPSSDLSFLALCFFDQLVGLKLWFTCGCAIMIFVRLCENGFDIKLGNGRETNHISYTLLTNVKLFCAWLPSELENQLKSHSLKCDIEFMLLLKIVDWILSLSEPLIVNDQSNGSCFSFMFERFWFYSPLWGNFL
jgi:hypothetical protein